MANHVESIAKARLTLEAAGRLVDQATKLIDRLTPDEVTEHASVIERVLQDAAVAKNALAETARALPVC